MRSLLCIVFVFGVASCSRSESARKPPGETVGIILEGGNGARLQVRVTFASGVTPDPHVQPIAAALAGARTSCFGPGIGAEAVSVVHLQVRAKQIHATSNNAWGDCLAKAIEGKPIEDASDFEVDLSVSVAAPK